jgi:amidohydrolase
MLKEAREIQQQLTQWRRTIHRQPELGFDVHHTAELVATILADLGIRVQTGVGKTGVVGYLGAGDGPVIGIRADMDALPIQEENEVEYASQVPGQMHACGHDAHTTMLLGAAMLLSHHNLPAQVRFLFQPSEEMGDDEGVSGAPRMIADGALEGVDAVIALHVDGSLDTGRVSVGDGWVGAAVDTFRAHIIGQGGHGAFPHQALDPIWLASQVLNALYALPSRRVAPLQPSVVSVGVIRGGSADNVIPDAVYLEGTLRSFADDVREQLIQEVEHAMRITRAFGGDYHLQIERGYPATYNDPIVVGWLRRVGSELLGRDKVGTEQKTMGAEDFSFMAKATRGAMFRLGVKPPGAEPRYLHTSTFDLDEEALPIGAAILAETARRFVYGELSWR